MAAAHDTTTCLVADKDGNVVAATPSGWSGVVAGDTGVWLGSRLQSFNTWEDHPDVIEPGKRPRITLSPTIVLDRDGDPALAISVAGGDNQDQMTLQLLVDRIDFGLLPADAVQAPRFMTDHFISSFGQKPPALGQLRINPEMGHGDARRPEATRAQAGGAPGSLAAAPCFLDIIPFADGPLYKAAGDPRTGRHVASFP